MKTADPIKNKKDVKKMLGFYHKKDNYNLRNYLLIAVGLFAALRICDILLLKWSDVLTKDGKVSDHITVKEKKTGKINVIAVNKGASSVLLMSIYNHSSFAITKRCLRISQTEKDEAFLSLSYN